MVEHPQGRSPEEKNAFFRAGIARWGGALTKFFDTFSRSAIKGVYFFLRRHFFPQENVPCNG